MALYALRDPKLSTRIDSVTCLATPFIHCSPRNVERCILPLSILVGTLAAILALAVYIPIMVKIVNFFQEDSLLESLIGVLFMIGFLFVGIIPFAIVRHRFQKHDVKLRLIMKQVAILSRLAVSNTPAPTMYALRYKRDEARRYLRGLVTLSESPFFTFGALHYLLHWTLEFMEGIDTWPATAERLAGMKGYNDYSGIFLVPAALAVIAITILMIPLWLLMAVAHLIFRRHQAGFGEQLSESLAARITVDSDPPYHVKATAIEYSFAELSKRKQSGSQTNIYRRFALLHSLIYSDHEILKDITDIVRKSESDFAL